MKTLPLHRMFMLLFRQAVLHRHSQGSIWLTWFLLGLAALCCLLPLAARDWRLVLLALLPLAAIVILWGVTLIQFCREQYWQRTAGLVPGLRAGIRKVVIPVTLGVPLVAGALGGLVVGYPVLGIATMLLAVSLGPWLWVGIVLPQFVPVWVREMLLHPAGQACLLAAAAWCWWSYYRRTYPASDMAIAYGHDLFVCEEARSDVSRARPSGHWTFRLLTSSWYARDIENDVRRGQNLAIQLLAGAGHWTTSIAALIVPGLVVVGLLVFTNIRLQGEYLVVMQCLFVASLWLLGISKAQQMVRHLGGTVVEQGLLALAPRMQSGSALTREIVGGMWKRWIVWWIASTAGVLIALAAGFDTLEQWFATLAFLSTSVIMSALLVRDYSRAFKPMEIGSWSFLRMLLLTWVYIGAFFAWRAQGGELSWLVLLLANLGTACFLLWSRWRALDRAPQIFPVGRFA